MMSAHSSRIREPETQTYDYVQRGASPLHILLVEDEASDRLLAEVALDNAGVEYEMLTLQNGQEVLPYLRHEGKYHGSVLPDLLLLDLSLPIKDGFEILTELAEQSEQFGSLPIVILTADAHSGFLRYSYGLTIAAFVIKPCTAVKINAVIARVHRH